MGKQTVDYVVVGSGFGGSVSAMRLTEKGYKVLVLEKGRRWRDEDFPKSNWNIFKYLWKPMLRCFGIQQITFMNNVMVLHGTGVGGGSLVYANVLMKPGDRLFAAPAWRELQDWKTILEPHYDTACRMLGVTRNPHLTPADEVFKALAEEWGTADSFQPTPLSIFFGAPGEEGRLVPDPYFGGAGPARKGCTLCGGCMVGCRHNAKNTLTKNYLYFAEKWGAEIRAESEVIDIQPLPAGQADGARYVVVYRRSTGFPFNWRQRRVRTRNVVVAAHALGTMKLLFRCRDITRSLPDLSPALGTQVRTNSETIPGSTARGTDVDYSKGAAITSIMKLDHQTHVEPVRYPSGSGFIRTLAVPMIDGSGGPLRRFAKMVWHGLTHPRDFLYTKFFGKWARFSTIILIMQTAESTMRIRLGRNLFTGFRRGLVSKLDPGQSLAPPQSITHGFARAFARRTNGIPQDSIPETLFNMPSTAHLLGGCPMGRRAADGVVDKDCAVFNYPGLYIVDGSIMPGNPGVNPSLTITALAEYAMSKIPPREGTPAREPFGSRAEVPAASREMVAR